MPNGRRECRDLLGFHITASAAHGLEWQEVVIELALVALVPLTVDVGRSAERSLRDVSQYRR
jgi:hypothetical protein